MAERLVDSSVVIDLLHAYKPATEWLAGLGAIQLTITPIAFMEVIEGKNNKIKRQRAVKFLSQFEMIYLTPEDQEWAIE